MSNLIAILYAVERAIEVEKQSLYVRAEIHVEFFFLHVPSEAATCAKRLLNCVVGVSTMFDAKYE